MYGRVEDPVLRAVRDGGPTSNSAHRPVIDHGHSAAHGSQTGGEEPARGLGLFRQGVEREAAGHHGAETQRMGLPRRATCGGTRGKTLDRHSGFSLTIEPTPVTIRSPRCEGVRIWRGETNAGIPVTVLVASVCSDSANQADFEVALNDALHELTELRMMLKRKVVTPA